MQTSTRMILSGLTVIAVGLLLAVALLSKPPMREDLTESRFPQVVRTITVMPEDLDRVDQNN